MRILKVNRPPGERGFTVRMENKEGQPYHWSSKNTTLYGPGFKNKTRFSKLFTKTQRRKIKSAIPPKPPSPPKVSPNNVPNIRMRKQQGGTCWFHALINGLIMSYVCRKVIKKRLEQELNSNNMGLRGLFGEEEACLSKSASPSMFWKYIAHRLGGRGRVNYNYRNANVIRNMKLRSSGITKLVPKPSKTPYIQRVASAWPVVHGGGLMPDITNLYSKLFPGDFKVGFNGTSTPTFIISTIDTRFNEYVNHNGAMYRLSHANIILRPRVPIAGHAIAGYVTRNGKYNVYDSGTDQIFSDVAWNQSGYDKYLLDAMNERWKNLITFTSIKKRAFYVRI